MTDQRNALQLRLSEPYKHGVECSCPACDAQTRALEEQQRTNEVESPSHELATLRPEQAMPDEGRERLRAKLQQPIRPGLAAPVPPPRYDEVFADGVAWLRDAVEAADKARGR